MNDNETKDTRDEQDIAADEAQAGYDRVESWNEWLLKRLAECKAEIAELKEERGDLTESHRNWKKSAIRREQEILEKDREITTLRSSILAKEEAAFGAGNHFTPKDGFDELLGHHTYRVKTYKTFQEYKAAKEKE